MGRPPPPRLAALKALAAEVGLGGLAALELELVRSRPPPPRLVAALLRPEPPGAELTPRQREVMVLLVSGYSRPEIADELGVGVETVKTHLQAVYGRLGVHRQIEAVNAFLESAA